MGRLTGVAVGEPSGAGGYAQSGDIDDSQSTWMEMKVCGPGTLSFRWKTSCGTSDVLRFLIDGVAQDVLIGDTSWLLKSFNVAGLGMHILRWEYVKDASGSDGEDCGWVDAVQWQPGSLSPSANLKAGLDTSLDVYTGGEATWYSTSSPSYYGNDSAQSGYIYDEQVSQMEVRVYGSGTATFWWKVSSEYGDYLEFWLDGVRRDRIDGEVDWQQKSYQITGEGLHSLMWQYIKDSSGSENDDRGWVDYLQWDGGTPPAPPAPPDELAEAVDSGLSFTRGGDGLWTRTTTAFYYDGDCATVGSIGDNEAAWMQTTVEGAGTLTFWWKVDSASGDYLEFYIGANRQAYIDGQVGWQQKTYVLGAGSHTLKWQYAKDGSESGYDYCWVDFVQWSGAGPDEPDPNDWTVLSYTYDASGRRIAKKYDGKTILRYVYDGDHCIAEYAGSGPVLRRKYIYGPAVDEPICMIEGAATSYYHFDALGSVITLTDANGDVEQEYEYSIWGQVGADDPNHTNPYMFTGRRFDKETGLYYYRARYYHPEIGRFLQTDPVGYRAGMHLYRYCGNSPLNWRDPFGLFTIAFYWGAKANFAEAANDHDFYFDMTECPEDVDILDWIEEKIKSVKDEVSQREDMKWEELDGIYFYDDTIPPEPGANPNELTFCIGTTVFTYTQGGDNLEIEEFMRRFGHMLDRVQVPDTCRLNFRQDSIGNTSRPSLIKDLARWTGRTVTALSGQMRWDPLLAGVECYWDTYYPDGEGLGIPPDHTNAPDYWYQGPLLSADPLTGDVTTIDYGRGHNWAEGYGTRWAY